MSDPRVTLAAHARFPGDLLDGAMPNGSSGVLVTGGLADFDKALMAAERDHSEAMVLFSPTVADVTDLLELRRQSDAEVFVTTEKDAINLGPLIEQLAPIAIAAVTMQLADAEAALSAMLRTIAERRGARETIPRPHPHA